MNLQEIRNVAQNHGLKLGKCSKLDMVRQIQLEEGNFACFGTAIDGECDQSACLWKKDCLVSSKRK